MMFFSRKKSIAKQVSDTTNKLEPEVRELMVGRRTIVSLLSFAIGSVLVGNSMWLALSGWLGGLYTGLVGLVMFVVGGIIHQQFKK